MFLIAADKLSFVAFLRMSMLLIFLQSAYENIRVALICMSVLGYTALFFVHHGNARIVQAPEDAR